MAMGVRLMGRPGKGVMPKDIALALIGAALWGWWARLLPGFIYSIQLCEMESKLQV
jgi:hypothetical protein